MNSVQLTAAAAAAAACWANRAMTPSSGLRLLPDAVFAADPQANVSSPSLHFRHRSRQLNPFAAALIMAPGEKRVSRHAVAASPSASSLPRLLRWPVSFARGLLFDHAYFRTLFVSVLLAELVLGIAIIQRIACQTQWR